MNIKFLKVLFVGVLSLLIILPVFAFESVTDTPTHTYHNEFDQDQVEGDLDEIPEEEYCIVHDYGSSSCMNRQCVECGWTSPEPHSFNSTTITLGTADECYMQVLECRYCDYMIPGSISGHSFPSGASCTSKTCGTCRYTRPPQSSHTYPSYGECSSKYCTGCGTRYGSCNYYMAYRNAISSETVCFRDVYNCVGCTSSYFVDYGHSWNGLFCGYCGRFQT